jgi:MFS family permease
MDYSKNVKVLTWQGFFIGLSFWAPIAAIYFSQVSGSYALGLSIFSIVMISSAAFELPTGIFSDYLGRKYTTMIGGLFYTLAMVTYVMSFNYWILVLGAVFEGLARSMYSGNNDAYLYESLHQSKKQPELEKWMGYIGSAEQWALGISAVIGGILAAISIKLVLWISVIPVVLCWLSSFLLKDIAGSKNNENNIFTHLSQAWKGFVKNKKLRLLSLSDIIGFGLGESSFQFTPVFVASLWPMWAVGAARMIAHISAALGFGISGFLLKKFKPVSLLLFEQISSKITNMFAFIFPSFISPALLSSTSILYGPSTVAQQSLMQFEFNDKQRATMGSLNSFGKNIFFGISMILLGVIADHYNPRIALILGQVFGLASVWLTWKLVRITKQNPLTTNTVSEKI